jgi:hypothetical protein
MRLLPRVDGLTAVKALPWMARHGCLETSARNLLLQRRTQGARLASRVMFGSKRTDVMAARPGASDRRREGESAGRDSGRNHRHAAGPQPQGYRGRAGKGAQPNSLRLSGARRRCDRHRPESPNTREPEMARTSHTKPPERQAARSRVAQLSSPGLTRRARFWPVVLCPTKPARLYGVAARGLHALPNNAILPLNHRPRPPLDANGSNHWIG